MSQSCPYWRVANSECPQIVETVVTYFSVCYRGIILGSSPFPCRCIWTGIEYRLFSCRSSSWPNYLWFLICGSYSAKFRRTQQFLLLNFVIIAMDFSLGMLVVRFGCCCGGWSACAWGEPAWIVRVFFFLSVFFVVHCLSCFENVRRGQAFFRCIWIQ